MRKSITRPNITTGMLISLFMFLALIIPSVFSQETFLDPELGIEITMPEGALGINVSSIDETADLSTGVFVNITTNESYDWVLVRMYYTDDAVAEQGLVEESLKLNIYNHWTHSWESIEESTVDASENHVTANLTHLGLFGTLGIRVGAPSSDTTGSSSSGSFSLTTASDVNPDPSAENDAPQLSPATVVTLSVGGSSSFTLGSSTHTITVDSINEDSVFITIRSDPLQILIKLLETVAVDVDFNGVDDLEITLNSIMNGEAELSYTQLNSGLGATQTGASLAEPSASETQVQDSRTPTGFAIFTANKIGLTSAILVALILVGLTVYLWGRKK